MKQYNYFPNNCKNSSPYVCSIRFSHVAASSVININTDMHQLVVQITHKLWFAREK